MQVEAASWLSVVVRWGPFRNAVNGTLVARSVRMTLHTAAPLARGPTTCPQRSNCVLLLVTVGGEGIFDPVERWACFRSCPVCRS